MAQLDEDYRPGIPRRPWQYEQERREIGNPIRPWTNRAVGEDAFRKETSGKARLSGIPPIRLITEAL
jgi:hypothetical protein